MGRKLVKGEFDLEDFRRQLREVKKMGPLSQILDMIPGFSQVSKEMSPEITDQQMKQIEAIINSMTLEERHDPKIINASRKRRIAHGSGTTVQEINQLLAQFRQMQRMMKQMSSGRGPLAFLRQLGV
jgi:signal recognition particle subunit SRP54